MIEAAKTELKSAQAALKKIQRALSAAEKKFADPKSTSLAQLAKAQKALSVAINSSSAHVGLPAVRTYAEHLAADLESFRRERTDVNRRRESLAAAAKMAGWPAEHTGAKDYVGPFSIEHKPNGAVISFGSYQLQKVKEPPSGEELMAALDTHRSRLDADARKGWDEFITDVLAAQTRLSLSEPIPWPKLVAEVLPDPKARRRAGKVLLFRLAMLLSGEAPGGNRLQIVPPTLSEQRSAVTVPKLNRANDQVRVYRVRLS